MQYVLICGLLIYLIYSFIHLFSVFIPRNRQRHQILDIFARLQKLHHKIESGSLDKADFTKFDELAQECLAKINNRSDSDWGRGFEEVLTIRNQIHQLLLSVVTKGHVQSSSIGSDIEKLALLRKQDLISEHEFQAFSERFKTSTGEKASQIIGAIGDLHEQYKGGAMTEGNYHASLWSLMDKLERKT